MNTKEDQASGCLMAGKAGGQSKARREVRADLFRKEDSDERFW